MKKIGIFYGSSTGNTQTVAENIGGKLGVSKTDIFDIANTPVGKMHEYDFILLGSSTWGMGDVQDDWDSIVLEKADLNGKLVAVFGTGDSSSYPDSFCDAIGTLAQAAQKAGATLVANKVDTADYTFDESTAVVDGYFCGLPIDEDNESDQTEERVEKWVESLKENI